MSSRTVFALTVVLAVVLTGSGCNGSTAPRGPVSLAGSWDFTDIVANAQLPSSCQLGSSVLALSQNGGSRSVTFRGGAQICTLQSYPPDTLSLAGEPFAAGWQISGDSVTFLPEYPQYGEGTVSGSPPNYMSGDVHCTVSARTICGHWQAALIIGRAKPVK